MIPKKIKKELFKKPNVVSVGWGYKYKNGVNTGIPSICVGVVEKKSISAFTKKDLIPVMIDNFITDVWQVGEIKKLSLIPKEFNQRYRPAMGGVSIGHPDITAGTLGCLCYRDGKLCILSNNHVMANSNNAKIGDPTYQPGSYDGGKPDDEIAKLSDFIEVIFQGMPEIPCEPSKYMKKIIDACLWAIGSSYKIIFYKREDEAINLVDAALSEANPSLVTPEIAGIGNIHGIGEGSLGLKIQKSGRTTEVTKDEIQQVDVTVNVGYGENKVATFEDQLMAGAMSAGGDSGSAVLSEDNKIVGLLFAGSDTITVINRIQNVMKLLKIERFV